MRAAHNAIKVRDKQDTEWFVVGVFISFLGAALDNTFWQLAWTSDALNLPTTQWFMTWGPTFNIFFRQIPGIVAACCHVKAASTKRPDSIWRLVLLMSGIAGVMWATGLLVTG